MFFLKTDSIWTEVGGVLVHFSRVQFLLIVWNWKGEKLWTISSLSFSSRIIFMNLQQNRAGQHQIKLRYSDRQTQVGENLVSYSRTPEAAMFWRMAPLHRVAVGESLEVQLAWAESAWGPGAWWPGMRGPARMAGMGRKGPDCAQTRVQCQAGKQTNQKKLRHVDTGTTLKRSESNGTNETDLRKTQD